jgi:solute carrier family 25 S-adenosylmethionine transporter 26
MDEFSPKNALIAGAISGLGVDLALFPLDTLKTRLQSKTGFYSSGGFARLWAGIGPVAIGSAPGAAIFFLAYESGKALIPGLFGDQSTKTGLFLSQNPVFVHMASASLAEIAACVVRVPVEVIKQRMQVSAGKNQTSSVELFRKTLQIEGIAGLFRGYSTTVFREIPFSLIQFPLWEWLKVKLTKHNGTSEVSAVQSGICGAISGGFSAAITTPLDVAKTRIMLAEANSEMAQRQCAIFALKTVWTEKGVSGLFSGISPRVAWISIGGALFLGIYDFSVSLLKSKNL